MCNAASVTASSVKMNIIVMETLGSDLRSGWDADEHQLEGELVE